MRLKGVSTLQGNGVSADISCRQYAKLAIPIAEEITYVNISQIMRGLLGEAVSGDVRAMELKVGQIVRGVVMQALENNEALIQINGVQVRAKLEMPLSQGQSALLQVQPESNGSLIVLKAVEPSSSGLLDDTFRDLAKMLGLPDQRWALELIKDLRKEGFPFNRATARAFQDAAASMPQGADQEQWMTAAAATFKRGLPMTAATISSMGQTMFGKPVHELLDSLQRQLGEFLASGQNNSGEADAMASRQAGARVLALLEQGNALLRGAFTSLEGGTTDALAGGDGHTITSAKGAVYAGGGNAGSAANATDGDVVSADSSKRGVQLTGNGTAGSNASVTDEASSAASSSGRGVQTAGNGSGWLGGMMKWLGVDHEHQLAKAATSIAASTAQREAAGDHVGTLDNSAAAKQANGVGQAQSSQAGLIISDAETEAEAQLQNRWENAATRLRTDTGAAGGSMPPSDDAPGASAADAKVTAQPHNGIATHNRDMSIAGDGRPAEGFVNNTPPNVNSSAETLKSALMALTEASDTPPVLKETAQQLVQQITGQQLLLTPERNSSVFTHVTMFIPFQDAKGGTTASVHIQTRRGKRGELDAENCRLLFNLTMSSLGDTLVDVNITDKIVSLNIWNDHPAIADIMESSKTDIMDRLQETGYQLLSLRTTPLPKRNEESLVGEPSGKGKMPAPPDLSQFASTRYKGVDYRA